MFAFITIGTNNLKKSSQFYDELLKTLGIIKVIQDKSKSLNDDDSYNFLVALKDWTNKNVM